MGREMHSIDDRGRKRAVRFAWVAAAALVGAGCSELPAARGTTTLSTLDNGAILVHNLDVPTWGEAEEWTLVEDLRLGLLDGEGPEVFGDVRAIEVDDEGSIFVLDASAGQVRVFSPDGDHLVTFGREGEGPGEFKQPRGLTLDGQGRAWVTDMGTQRHSVWSLEGELLRDHRRFGSGNVSPWPGTVLDDGRVVDVVYEVTDNGRESRRVLFDSAGLALLTIPVPHYQPPLFVAETEISRTTANVPFAPNQTVRFTDEGQLWTGVPERYEIVQHDLLTGDTVMVIRKDFTSIAVSDREKDIATDRLAWMERQGGKIERSLFPKEHAAYRDFMLDDAGFIWVVPTLARTEQVTEENIFAHQALAFDVFDPNGGFLGSVESPIYLRGMVATATHLYGITTDDLGVQYVVRMKIAGRA